MILDEMDNALVEKVRKAYGPDRGGWWHAERLSTFARSQDEWRVALCHDLIEDKYATYEDLLAWGLTHYERMAVKLLTRVDNQTYTAYIDSLIDAYERGLEGAVLAVRVKYIDLFDHIRPDRVGNISASHVKRYTAAITRLAPYLCKEA